MNTPHFSQKEKDTIREILDKQGDKLKNGILLMKNRGRTEDEIVATISKLPKVQELPTFKIKWLAVQINEKSPEKVQQIIRENNTPRKLHLLKKPEDVGNIYEWFVNNHESEIQNFLSKGGTLKEIVRKFNQAYNPGADPQLGRETLRKKIKIKQMRKSSIQWMREQKSLIKDIREGKSAKSLFEEAQGRGFSGTLRLFQMRVKTIKEEAQKDP